MPEVTISMDSEDFDRLSTVTNPWSGTSWPDHTERFQIVDGSPRIDRNWRFAFWVGQEWSAVLLARSFLSTIGESYQILWDTAEDPAPGYVILTNHLTRAWAEVHRTPVSGLNVAGGEAGTNSTLGG